MATRATMKLNVYIAKTQNGNGKIDAEQKKQILDAIGRLIDDPAINTITIRKTVDSSDRE